MSNLPMMPWWPKDWISATRGWTLVERSLYRELLDAQWVNGPLPEDEAELARIAGAETHEFDAAWPRVSRKFIVTDDGLINRKLEEHRGLAVEYHDKRRRAGQAGGLASARARAEQNNKQSLNGRSTVVPATVKHPSPSPSPKVNMENVDSDYQKIENLNHEAWKIWQAHRRKCKLRKYTTLMKARDLAALPEPMQIECVKFSISNQYSGLFPDRFKGGANVKKTYAQELKEGIDASHN